MTAYEEERMPNEELVHVLDGYKVLDFTQVLAGPDGNAADGRDGR